MATESWFSVELIMMTQKYVFMLIYYLKNGKWKALLALFYFLTRSIQMNMRRVLKRTVKCTYEQKSVKSNFSSHPTENFSFFDSTNGEKKVKHWNFFVCSKITFERDYFEGFFYSFIQGCYSSNHPWNLSVIDKSQNLFYAISSSHAVLLWNLFF